MTRARRTVKRGWYCTDCGALYSNPGSGIITCQRCGALGLRGFERVPKRVRCSICDFTGWDDGGVNDDLPRHMRLEHPQPVEAS